MSNFAGGDGWTERLSASSESAGNIPIKQQLNHKANQTWFVLAGLE